MRNAFVVLVSLCIGVVSGFIVPSSTTETTEKIYSTTVYKEVTVKAVNPTKSAVLPKNRTNIDEKYLFEHATETKNKQIERAYIYINQKYNKRKHPRNKLIKMTQIEKPGSASPIEVSQPSLMNGQQIPCINCQGAIIPVPAYVSNYQGFVLHDDKQDQENFLNLKAPDIFRWNFKDNSKDFEKVKMGTPDKRYEYLELLKVPLLRPENRKVNLERVTKINLPLSIHSSINPYRENLIKAFIKNQQLLKLKEAIARQNEIRRNYGFNNAMIQRPYEINGARDRTDELSFTNEGDNRKNYELNQEEDKLLEKYLKEALEDNMLIAHEPVRPLADCAQEDCKPRRKYSKTSNVFIKPDCTCIRTVSLKQVDAFVSNDRSLREDKRDHNETVPSSSELINYEEMLSEDSTMVKDENNYVITPPNIRKGSKT